MNQPARSLPVLDPDFVANASVDAIRTQYERAERMAERWADQARELFLLLAERTPEERTDG
ncbi:hypothetical protein [Streptomyces rubiginosohelvolus]|uniref:Uncharacterized protein n=1 Tax=Streptomyces rubiginosohelvolus TaxID=67362 RepID=A0ABQ3BPX9_9ACTN|nr:hypothetical protein [Streptomyces pluricolorescens]GGZ53060.1 hypothetical protein GCM10010328_29840 [Streptomyces pluricolorescens]